MSKNLSRLSLVWMVMLAAFQGAGIAQIQGLPASDVVGSEDLWENTTFVGGLANGGVTAHSEF